MTFNVLEDFSIETPEGHINLKQGQIIKMTIDEAIPIIEAGIIKPVKKVVYRVYSKILEANLWVVDTDADMISLRSKGIGESIYTKREIKELKRVPRENLKEIHMVKAIFLNSIIEEVKKID